jgi:hypothetical protein
MPWRRLGEWRYSSIIPGLGTRWRWTISFTPQPLYPRGKSRRYPLDRGLGGPQSRSECYGEKKNVAPTGNRTPAVQSVATPIELSQLSRYVVNCGVRSAFVRLKIRTCSTTLGAINAVINHRVRWKVGISWLVERLMKQALILYYMYKQK